MRQLQSGSVGGRWGGRFMRVMVVLTLEGLFSDPVYGGNQQEVGWKLIGFQPQEPRPRCPYKGRRQA